MRCSPTQLGDHRPRAMGRLTLNPIAAHRSDRRAHARDRRVRLGEAGDGQPGRAAGRAHRRLALVAFAGPIANVVVAVVACGHLSACWTWPASTAGSSLRPRRLIVLLNILLAIFNLIPIPPLDGYNVAARVPAPAAGDVHAAIRAVRDHRAPAARSSRHGQPASTRSAGSSAWPAGSRAAHRCIGSGSSSPTFARGSSRGGSTRAHGSCRTGRVALFDAMPVADRRHGLDVAERLLRRGHDDPDLLGAALLHDAAKGHRMRLWHRVAGVLLEALAPSAAAPAGQPGSSVRGGTRSTSTCITQPLSAELALAAGCSPRAGRLHRGAAPAGRTRCSCAR